MMTTSITERYGPLFGPEGVGSSSASSAPSGASPASGSASTDGGGGDSGGPTPSAPATSPTTPSSSPPRGGEASFDFGALFGDSDGDSGSTKLVGSEAAPIEPTPPPASPPQPKAAVPPEGAAVVPSAEVKVEAASAPTAAAAPDVGGPPTFDPYDPVALGTQLAQHEAQATQFAAEQMFQLSQEEREAIESDVLSAIPKLLARVFVKSQQSVLGQLGRIIPVMVQRQTQAMQKNEDGLSKFYQQWSVIDRTKHGDLVNKYATVYRQMHPQATLDQMISDLGPMIMMAARIAPPPPAAAKQGAPVASNGRPPSPSPFVPAGAGPVSSPKPVEMEAWEAIFRQ